VCNLYSITKNQAAIRGLFRVTQDSAGNLPPMPGVFPTTGSRGAPIRWWARTDHDALGHAAAEARRPACHQHPQHHVAALAGLAETGKPLLVPFNSFAEYAPLSQTH
jgi:hypothetical protein